MKKRARRSSRPPRSHTPIILDPFTQQQMQLWDNHGYFNDYSTTSTVNDRGSQGDRANQQIARAFVLRRLNRNEEADRALSAGLKLCKKPLP